MPPPTTPTSQRTGNATVLELHITETLKLGLIAVSKESKRVPEAEGLLDTDLVLD